MANGDVNHTNIEEFIQDVSWSSTSNPTEAEVETLCNYINNEVDSELVAAGFALDLAVTRNITWAEFTKLIGASALVLDAMYAVMDAESERAARWWAQYNSRLERLRDSGGNILDADDLDSSADPQYAPTLIGFNDRRRHLPFRERAIVQQWDDAQGLRATRASWKQHLRKV